MCVFLFCLRIWLTHSRHSALLSCILKRTHRQWKLCIYPTLTYTHTPDIFASPLLYPYKHDSHSLAEAEEKRIEQVNPDNPRTMKGRNTVFQGTIKPFAFRFAYSWRSGDSWTFSFYTCLSMSIPASRKKKRKRKKNSLKVISCT